MASFPFKRPCSCTFGYLPSVWGLVLEEGAVWWKEMKCRCPSLARQGWGGNTSYAQLKRKESQYEEFSHPFPIHFPWSCKLVRLSVRKLPNEKSDLLCWLHQQWATLDVQEKKIHLDHKPNGSRTTKILVFPFIPSLILTVSVHLIQLLPIPSPSVSLENLPHGCGVFDGEGLATFQAESSWRATAEAPPLSGGEHPVCTSLLSWGIKAWYCRSQMRYPQVAVNSYFV